MKTIRTQSRYIQMEHAINNLDSSEDQALVLDLIPSLRMSESFSSKVTERTRTESKQLDMVLSIYFRFIHAYSPIENINLQA